jgi:hypothetical protein
VRIFNSTIDVSSKIGLEQAKSLANVLKVHPTLKSLCGNTGKETELDMSGSGKRMGAEGFIFRTTGLIMLVPEIVNNSN